MATPTDTTSAIGRPDPTAEWQSVLSAPRSDAERARIAAALELADATLHAATQGDRPLIRSVYLTRDALMAGSAFSRVALMWHRVLTDTDAFARSRASEGDTCRFDPDAVRTWLTGSHPSGDGTVAEALNIGADFDIYGFDKWVRISNLLAQAQDAGVFGVPDHTVGVLHLAGERGFVDRHRVTLDTPRHAVLCSDDLDTADLMTEHLDGVDAAVHVLEQVARAADRLLHQRAILADVAWPTPSRDPEQAARPGPEPARPHRVGNAFGPLRLDTPTAPARSGHTEPSTESGVRRNR
jgi:hypothetical protein